MYRNFYIYIRNFFSKIVFLDILKDFKFCVGKIFFVIIYLDYRLFVWIIVKNLIV